VQHGGDRYEITGGTPVGANLFHSFEQFGLQAGETANFIANPSIANILGRITGGDASYINGLIQVSNSNANLFLMNPAGLVFGPHGQLNLGGSFTATTATGIGFEGGWFPAIGPADFTTLVGSPNQFHFSPTATQASLVNQGDLTVNSGQSLGLIAGTVVNTGNLTAPEGQITVLAVPETQQTQIIRLSQTGMLLNLEFSPDAAAMALPNSSLATAFNPLTLPDLLTGGAIQNATDLTIAADGTVQLRGSGLGIATTPGTTIVTGLLEARGGGSVAILGDRVALVQAQVDVSGSSGGVVRIGGDFQGQATIPTAQATVIDSQSQILANALETGEGGRVFVWSDDWTLFQGNIQAQGGNQGGNGGFVEVSGQKALQFQGLVDVSAPAGTWGTLLLDPTNITITAAGPSTVGVDAALPDISAGDFASTDITIQASTLESQAANVILQATDHITLAPGLSLNFTSGGTIEFVADQDGDGVGDFTMDPTQSITASGRNLSISGVNLALGSIDLSTPDATPGGSLNLVAASTTGSSQITVSGNLNTQSQSGSSGEINIQVQAETGANLSLGGDIQAGSPSGTAGNITINTASNTATNTVTVTGDLDTSVASGSGNGGDILLRAYNETDGQGTTVTITGNLQASAIDGNGGRVSVYADGGDPSGNASTALTITGNLKVSSQTGSSGSLFLASYASGGDATNVFSIDGNLDASSATGTGGTIDLRAVPSNQGLPLNQVGLSQLTVTGNLTTKTGGATTNAGIINLISSAYGQLLSTAPPSRSVLEVGGYFDASAIGGNAGSIYVSSTSYSDPVGGTSELTIGGNVVATGIGGGNILLNVGGDRESPSGSPTEVLSQMRVTNITGNSITLAGRAYSGNPSAGTVTVNLGANSRWEAQNGSLDFENIALNPGGFDLTISTNNFQITNPQPIAGTGNLTVQPFSATANLYLGGTPFAGFSGLFIENDFFNSLQDGFNSLTIGRTDGTGSMSFGSNLTFLDPVVLQMTGTNGSINTSGGSQVAQDGISLITDQTLTLGNLTIASNDLTATSNHGRLVVTGVVGNTGSGNLSLSANNTVGLASGVGVLVQSGASLLANGGHIQMTGTGASTGTPGTELAAGIILRSGSQVRTTGLGTITLQGRAGSLGSDNHKGISLDNATIETASGTIELQGTGSTGGVSNVGVSLTGSSARLSTGGGSITLQGTGGSGSPGGAHAGIRLGEGARVVTSGAGAINLTGTASDDSEGVLVVDSPTAVQAGDGPIEVTGTGAIGIKLSNAGLQTSGTGSINLKDNGSLAPVTNRIGLYFDNNSSLRSETSLALETPDRLYLENASLSSSSGGVNLSLTANEVDLLGTTSLSGQNLLIQPFSTTQTIAVGTGAELGETSLDLLSSDLDSLGDGFQEVTIGRSDGTGVVTLGSGFSLKDPTVIRGSNSGYTLQSSDTGTTFTFNGGNTTQITEGGITMLGDASLEAVNAQVIQGGASDDRFQFLSNSHNITAIDGGGGSNTLETRATSLTLTGANAGSSTNLPPFSNIQNITILGGNPLELISQSSGSLSGNLSAGSSDLILKGDQLNIGGQISGSGALDFQTLTPDTNTNLGSGLAGALNLSSLQLARLQNGFREVRIGDSTGRGAVTGLGSFSFLDPVVIRSAQGTIDLASATLQGSDNASFTMTAAQNLSIGDISSQNQPISLTSSQGSIAAADVTTQGGAITLIAPGLITSGDLNSSSGTGGQITVQSETAMTLGFVNSSGSSGNGGNVLLDPPGDIEVLAIDAQGGNAGIGGSVDITTDSLFRATSSFVDRNGITASISTAGGLGGGALTLRHGGGSTTPFTVGSSVPVAGNGTLGTLTTGRFTVADGSYPSSYSLTAAGEGFSPVDVGILPNLNLITTATLEPDPDPQPSTPEDVAPTPVLAEVCPPQCEGDLEPSIAVAEADRSVYLSSNFETLEEQSSRDVTDYLGLAPVQPASLEPTQEALRDIERLTGIKPAIIYVSFQPRRVTLPTALPGTLPSPLADPNAALKLGTTVSVLSPQPKNLDTGLSGL